MIQFLAESIWTVLKLYTVEWQTHCIYINRFFFCFFFEEKPQNERDATSKSMVNCPLRQLTITAIYLQCCNNMPKQFKFILWPQPMKFLYGLCMNEMAVYTRSCIDPYRMYGWVCLCVCVCSKWWAIHFLFARQLFVCMCVAMAYQLLHFATATAASPPSSPPHHDSSISWSSINRQKKNYCN